MTTGIVVPTSSMDQRIDFDAITRAGFRVGRAVFADCAEEGELSGSDLHMRASLHNLTYQDGLRPLDTDVIGTDAGGTLALNTRGKSITCAAYSVHSDTAYAEYGDEIPEGPQRWTGGYFHTAKVNIHGTWFELQIIVACSGVQGHYDLLVAGAIALKIGAGWAQRMKELAGIY